MPTLETPVALLDEILERHAAVIGHDFVAYPLAVEEASTQPAPDVPAVSAEASETAK